MRSQSPFRTATMVVTLGVLLGAAPLAAQDPGAPVRPGPGGEMVDRIVAIVGDSAIFRSDVLEHVREMQASGIEVPQEPVALQDFQRGALDDLVGQTLVLQAAAKDTLISVENDQVDTDLQAAWDEKVRTFGSEELLRQALTETGITPVQYRADLRKQIYQGQLSQRYLQSQLGTTKVPPVEESEIRALFERDRATFGNRPATISIRQVILLPAPSDSVKAAARTEASRILGLIRSGEDFSELARRFSDDPGSAQAGGDLGWVRQGEMVREFEDALFGLQRGEVSAVVETVFGAHIVRLDRIQGPQRSASHILIAAEPGEADVTAARTRANEIRAAIAGGTLISEFASEGERVGLPETAELSVAQLGQLPGGYATELQGAQPGDVLGPIEFQASQGQFAFGVVQVTGAREAGEFMYEDAREQIRGFLQDQKFRERLLTRLRAETYVEIRW
ncbi:MAG: hypothetical protein EXR92_04280 [Gemmatimonadetes bacterium]|nr:hypothetical protein [Gemmatimonadota bacterium]